MVGSYTVIRKDGRDHRWAEYSPCGAYRYALGIPFAESMFGSVAHGPLVVIGLNPSTATENEDDPTIRRVVGFARDLGHTGVIMLNRYAYRATDPKQMAKASDPYGPENLNALRFHTHADLGLTVVAAWGATVVSSRGELPAGLTLQCWGKTQGGSPRHPLYLPKSAKLELWRMT